MSLAQPIPAETNPAPLPERPEDVPERVSPALLRAVLTHGRPAMDDWLPIDGVSCPTGAAGTGRPVLLVHGLGHDAWDWMPLVERAPDGLALRWLDLPGFGLSDKPAQGWGLTPLVNAVLAAARACGQPPLVVGSSLGGHVAMLAALRDQRAFAGLLLVAPGGLEHVSSATQAVARGYYSVPSLLARADVDVVANSRRIFFRQSAASDALATRKLCVHRSAARATFARPFAGVVDDVFRHPVAERMLALQVPTRLLFGAHDVVVDPAMGRRAADAYGLPLEILDDTGHLPMVEAPDRFVSALRSCASAVFGG
jgi:pimeloyl-ACP methyl ester carboxylesterase